MKVNNDGSQKIANDFLRMEVVDFASGSSNETYTYSASDSVKTATNWLRGLIIANDGSTVSLAVTVNGITFTVLKGERIELNFQAFQTVTIISTVAWRLWLLQ
jgi:hypothetical protein